jgi:hypothetical protein
MCPDPIKGKLMRSVNVLSNVVTQNILSRYDRICGEKSVSIFAGGNYDMLIEPNMIRY